MTTDGYRWVTRPRDSDYLHAYEIGYGDGESSAHADWMSMLDDFDIVIYWPSDLARKLSLLVALANDEPSGALWEALYESGLIERDPE